MKAVIPRTRFLHPALPSLLRSVVLALGAFALSLHLGGFPDLTALHSSHWQAVPVVADFLGMVETARCMRRKWSLYQAGILLFLYTEVMILGLAVFLFFYP